MKKRAAGRDETRERIVRAAMALHDEQGVATTSFADVAELAEVGPATVLRHFPTLSSLVMACGEHVAAEMRPPSPADAGRVFAGLPTTHARLERLVGELDAFYARGSLRLIAAANDRNRVPELDQFLMMVDAGIETFIRQAIIDEPQSEPLIRILMGLSSISVWRWMNHAKLKDAERQGILVDLLVSAIASARSRSHAK